MSLGRKVLERFGSRVQSGCGRGYALDPNDPKETVSETLIEVLNIASTNLSMRSTEALQTLLQHCDELHERELIGLCKVVNDQSMLGKPSVDGILLDLLKFFVAQAQQKRGVNSSTQ